MTSSDGPCGAQGVAARESDMDYGFGCLEHYPVAAGASPPAPHCGLPALLVAGLAFALGSLLTSSAWILSGWPR